MNYNYKGSLAERFIRFRSGILATQDTSTDLFNAFSIYVPSNVANGNVLGLDLSGIRDRAIIKEVNVDNYRDVLTGDLLAQWAPIFRNDTNFDVILYIIVFYVPDGTGTDTFSDYFTVTPQTIDYSPLTNAFDNLYSMSFWKTLFSPSYDGLQAGGANYLDLALCLSSLCLIRNDLSYCILINTQRLPLATPDTNISKLMSIPYEEQIAIATSLTVSVPGVPEPRKDYFYGMLHLLQPINTWLITHSEPVNMIVVILATYFAFKNDTGTYIGNKLSKIRLSGSNVKPTGTPSWLNPVANENLPLAIAGDLDRKNVSYFISIADGTVNDSITLRAKSITGFPVLATVMSKWVDYFTSQSIAKMMTATNTLGNPVLKNERTYQRIQDMLLRNLQVFSRIGRLDNIFLNMPAYTELPESSTDIIITQGWEATYIDDLERVQVTGTVVV